MPSEELRTRIAALPEGYSRVRWQGRTYGLSVQTFNGGKSRKGYARDLAGTDFVSFNFYQTSERALLKPCEMPVEKVYDFLTQMVASG